MNAFNKKLFSLIAAAVLVFASLLVLGADPAGQLKDYDGIDGRAYHAEMHEKGKCRSCHGVKEPEGYPDDDGCDRCHDIEELVSATMPEADEDRWQNPHDNLHYGTDVPCVECHGEHTNKAPLCANCHNFEYSRHLY